MLICHPIFNKEKLQLVFFFLILFKNTKCHINIKKNLKKLIKRVLTFLGKNYAVKRLHLLGTSHLGINVVLQWAGALFELTT